MSYNNRQRAAKGAVGNIRSVISEASGAARGGGVGKSAGAEDRSLEGNAFVQCRPLRQQHRELVHHAQRLPKASLPPGFLLGDFNRSDDDRATSGTTEERNELVKKSAMNMALGPGKQMLGMAFMTWMTGHTLGIFSIMTLMMIFGQPIRGLMNFSTAFKRYESSSVSLIVPKLVYIVMNMAGLLLGLWKLDKMGLLPTGGGDWVAGQVQASREWSTGAIL